MIQKLCALYVRVSTKDQDPDSQISDLTQYSARRGLQIYKIYIDQGFSGKESSRPNLNLLMEDARKRKFGCVLVWRFDRFARSTKHLIDSLHEFRNLRIDFISYQENMDTSSPLGEAMFTMISAIAQLESDILSERIKSGIRRVIESGRTFGRPKRELDTNQILQLRAQGLSIRKIADQLEAPKSTVHEYLRELEPALKGLSEKST